MLEIIPVESRTRKTKFTQAPSNLVKDREISLASKGLFAFMQDKPDGWNFTIKSMTKQLKEGEHTVRKCLNELKSKGWVTYEKHHDGTGTYSLNFIPVITQPNVENPHVENQHQDMPNVENPHVENPHVEIPMVGNSTRIKQTDSLNRQNDRQTDVSCSDKSPAPTTSVFNAYVEGMKQRYGQGVNPARNAKVNGMLKNMISRIGLENAIVVARNYPLHQNGWYVQKIHSIDAMLQDCESLLVQVQSGQMITKTHAYQADKSGHYQNQVNQSEADPRNREVF